MKNKNAIKKVVKCIISAVVSVLVFAFSIAITVLCACLIPEGGARIGAILIWSFISGLSIVATSLSLWLASSFMKDIDCYEE